MELIAFVTDFADSAIIVPIAAAVLVLLLGFRETRRALFWAIVVGAVMGTVVVLKLTFAGCVPPSPLAAFRSPSGHTASAVMVYGGLATILGFGMVPAIVQSLVVAGLIGASRLLLAVHSLPEAIIGGGIGLIGTIALAGYWPAGERPERRRAFAIVAPLVVISLAVALHGTHWPSEQIIRRASSRFWPLQACSG